MATDRTDSRTKNSGANNRASLALIAGGGTAGHLVPGLAVANALVESGWPASQIHFVGSAVGLDSQLVPAAGFALTTLPGRGINRRGKNPVTPANFAAAWALLRGIAKGIALVRKMRPSVVLSLGGYAALPGSIGAIVMRVPLVLVEQNAVASGTNSMLSRFAKAAAVPTLGTGLRKEVLTGTPVRPEVIALAERSAARQDLRAELGWPDSADTKAVVIFGGSLGSLRINTATWQALEQLGQGQPGQLFIYHVVGKRDWDELPQAARDASRDPVKSTAKGIYRAVPYDDNLPVALAAADLVVCRAGASTIAELSVLAKAAVLVPLPGAPNDHQRRNAEIFAAAGQASIVDDADLDGARLAAEINAHLTDAGESDRTGTSNFASAHSAHRIAELALKHAAGPDTAGPDTTCPEKSK